MPSFKRLGEVLGDFNRFNRFGSGQHTGFRWNSFSTFEAGAVTPYPTGVNAVLGAGAANITVTAGAALRGNFGVNISIPNTNARYLSITQGLSNERKWEFEFLYNIENIVMGAVDQFLFFNSSTTSAVQLRLLKSGGVLYFLTQYFRDGSGPFNGAQMLAPSSGKINIKCRIADAPGKNNGEFYIYMNGLMTDSRKNLDNDTLVTNSFQLGCVAGLDAGTSGNIYLDNIGWSRDMR